MAFGDSLTEGYGASPGKDYPAQLGASLGIPIVNAGKTGETTADGLKRLPTALAANPRVVLLCFGGNDVLQGSAQSRMFGNLGQMIDAFLGEGTFVVLIGIRSTGLRDQNERGFRQLAREKNVAYVPNILKGIFPKPVYMADAVHPNDEGYRLIAARLQKELRPLLRSPKGALLATGTPPN